MTAVWILSENLPDPKTNMGLSATPGARAWHVFI
jgi:hypothetical protein